MLRREDGSGEMWFGDQLVASADNISDRDLTITGGTLTIGATGAGWASKMRRFQICAGAPTPEQIKAMARFVGDPLPGASDALLDMSYNAETGLLWCLTSDRKFAYDQNMALVHDEANTDNQTVIVSEGAFTMGG